MSSTKESIKKLLEEKRQGTKNQGTKKHANKNMIAGSQTDKGQRTGPSMVNKSI